MLESFISQFFCIKQLLVILNNLVFGAAEVSRLPRTGQRISRFSYKDFKKYSIIIYVIICNFHILLLRLGM